MFQALAGIPYKSLPKLKNAAAVVCRADGFVARHHQHQFEAPAQFILTHPMCK